MRLDATHERRCESAFRSSRIDPAGDGWRAIVRLLLGVLLVACCGCSAGGSTRVDGARAEAELEAARGVLAELEASRQADDLERFVRRLDPGVEILPPGQSPVWGAELAQTWLARNLRRLPELEAAADAVGEASGGWAYLAWSAAQPSPPPANESKVVRVLAVMARDVAGDWTLSRLVWNQLGRSREQLTGAGP